MKLSALAIVTASLALCGCSSTVMEKANSVVDYFGFGDDDAAAPPARFEQGEAPAAIAAVPPQADRAEEFCRGLAESERWKSQQLGSNSEIQEQIAHNTYRECMDGSSHWLD